MIGRHEKSLCDAIVEHLNYQGCHVWRTNSGAIPQEYTSKRTGKTSRRMIYMARKGTSDIIGLRPDGRFVAIEVKVPGREKDLTENQIHFLFDILQHHGVAGMATDENMALQIVEGKLSILDQVGDRYD